MLAMKEGKKPIILLTEDELSLQEVIMDCLLSVGFEVLCARSYDEAIMYLGQAHSISFLWLDHYLIDEKTGLDILSYVRASDKWSNLSVFVVSNTFNPEVKAEYLNLGIHQHYDKAASRLDLIVNDLQKLVFSPVI